MEVSPLYHILFWVEIFDHNFLKDVCHNVTHAQPLQSLSGESLTYRTACRDDGARLDVAADCFWGTLGQRVFFDVTVINPLSQMH